MTKKQEQILEKYDLDVTNKEDKIEMWGFSPAGQELVFYANKNENLKDFFKKEYENFNEEEHIIAWLEAKKNGVKGVPGIFTLVDNAEYIKDMLENLSIEL